MDAWRTAAARFENESGGLRFDGYLIELSATRTLWQSDDLAQGSDPLTLKRHSGTLAQATGATCRS
jgi:hypothetical protein